jgi:flagellar biosynthesis/type III secretory pathway protein FliH
MRIINANAHLEKIALEKTYARGVERGLERGLEKDRAEGRRDVMLQLARLMR